MNLSNNHEENFDMYEISSEDLNRLEEYVFNNCGKEDRLKIETLLKQKDPTTEHYIDFIESEKKHLSLGSLTEYREEMKQMRERSWENIKSYNQQLAAKKIVDEARHD